MKMDFVYTDIIGKKKEIEYVLDVTCRRFGIDTKTDLAVGQNTAPPLAEFSYDEEKLEILDKFYKQKGIKKSKKGKSTQELELEKGVNELIDGYMDQLQLRQTVNQDLDDTFVDVKNTKKKLVGEVECSFCLQSLS